MLSPRLTVRRLMVAVALVGLVLGFEITRRRREAFLEMGRRFGNTASVMRSESNGTDDPGPHGDPVARRRLADYCETLHKKYEQAARYPWRPVGPDPPAPE